MKVILKEDIAKLGTMGETVQVAPGYGRNYLIPQGKAVLATSKNFKELEHHRRLIQRKVELIRKDAESFAEKFRGLDPYPRPQGCGRGQNLRFCLSQ